MKKIIILITLVLTIIFTIAGCGNAESKTSETNNNNNNNTKKSTELNNNKTLIHSKPENFVYDDAKINEDGYAIDYYNDEADIMEIPDTYDGKVIVEIGKEAFANQNIKEVMLGENIIKIDTYAFVQCAELNTINFNDKLKVIGDAAFLASGLKGKLVIPDSVEEIEECAFASVEIEEVHLGKNVKFIGEQAFAGNSNLKEVFCDSKDVEFEDYTVFEDSPNVTIIASKDSTAEKFAKENNISFKER